MQIQLCCNYGYRADQSVPEQWHRRCAIDMSIRYVISLFSGIFILGLMLCVGEARFESAFDNAHFKKGIYLTLICIAFEFILFWICYIVINRLTKHNILEPLLGTYRRHGEIWLISFFICFFVACLQTNLAFWKRLDLSIMNSF